MDADMRPIASVVIPLYQRADLTEGCLNALERVGLDGIELVMVDNACTDETPQLLDAWSDRLTVIRNETNLGFAAGCNQGARAATGPIVIFLNNDTEVHEGWLEPLLAAVADDRVGVAGSRLLYPTGRVQHAGMAVMPGCVLVHIHRYAPGDHPVVTRTRDLTVVTGACMAIRRERFLELRGFDEGYRNGYEDTDLCMRLASLGLVARYCGDSVITHLESASPGRLDSDHLNGALFRRRWGGCEPDLDRLLAEDGLSDLAPPGLIWRGPLLDASPEATAGRAAMADLAAHGMRPAVLENPMRPCVPGIGHDLKTLAAVNRLYLSRGPARVLHHLVPGGPAAWGAPGADLVAIVGPGAGVPDALAPDTRAVIALGAAHGQQYPLVSIDSEPIGIADALDFVLGPMAERPDGIGFWGPAVGPSPAAATGRALIASVASSGRPVRCVASDAEDADPPAPLGAIGPQDFLPEVWIASGPPLGRDGGAEWDRLTMAVGGLVVGRPWTYAAEWPSSWTTALRAARELWVASRMHRDALVADGLDPARVAVVPEPLDTHLFRPLERATEGTPITFLCVCRPGWGGGCDLALRAFVDEFGADEPVKLRLVAEGTDSAQIESDVLGVLAAMGRDPADTPDIDLVAAGPSLPTLATAYREADAVVSVPRLDAFGNGVMRALASGVPIIACADGHHGHLVDSRGGLAVELAARPKIPWRRGGDVAEPNGLHGLEVSIASLRQRMRELADDPFAARRGALFTVSAATDFAGAEAVARVIDRRLDGLHVGRAATLRVAA